MGWARANVMYDTAKRHPPPGSPLESMFILVWWMRRDIDYYLARTMVQSAIDPDEGKSTSEAWKEFTEHFYPYLKGQRKRHDQAAMGALMKEVKKGFMAVRPLVPLVKSKLSSRRVTVVEQH